ncbi:MAG: TonB-dependent receptor [Treponema sp.]|jgi:vitamin B12 transporter|nr:TonB-dependent receptor [Treponema sp.]
MRLSYPRAGGLLPACILSLRLLSPVLAGENADGEEGYAVIMENEEGITITGTPETTQQTKVITREEIEKTRAPDLAVLLQETLDLSLVRRGPYGNETDINMRGFDSERIAFLIDGVPVNSGRPGTFEISSLDIDAVERIEVIYGGSDTKYNVSGALGGVINIVTVKKQPSGLRLGGGISNTSALPGTYYNRSGGQENPQWQDLADTQNLNLFAGLGLENFSWSAAWFGNRAANHYLLKDYYNVVRRKENNEVWDTGASTSFIWELPEYAKFILSGDLYYGDKNIPTPSELSRTRGTQVDFSTRQNIMLDMPRIFRDDLAMEASLSHAWQTLDYTSSSENSLHKENALTAINRWSWALEKLTLRSGGDYRYTHIDSTDAGVHHEHEGGVYFTAEYAPWENVLFIPSVKAVFRDSTAVPVPKLGLLWRVRESFALKNNYYRSFKFPSFNALYWNQPGYRGNPDLKPEDGWGGDLIAEFRRKDWLRLESAFYAQWIENSIHWSNASGLWRPENVAEAVFFGWDSRIRLELPLPFKAVKKIIPSVSYKYLLSYIITATNGEDLGFSADIRIPYAPMHTLGVSLEIPWESGSLLVSGHYESLRYGGYTVTPAAAINTDKLEPVFLLNVSLNQRINKNLELFAALRNILNKSYQSFYDYHMPGISLTAGMKVKAEFPVSP